MIVTEIALKFRTTVYVLIVFIVIVGMTSYMSMPLEAAPEIQIPVMFVSTIYPGVSPEDMERLVTNQLERELKTLKNVKSMTSSSAESISSIQVEFETGVDLDMAYQKVKDNVDKAKPKLPPDAEDPIVTELSISDFPILTINISAPYDLVRLKQVGERLQDEIEQIPGVLSADLSGGLDREIQIYLDPAKMEYYKVGVGQVINRIRQEHQTTPAGGLELAGNKYSVRIPGEYKNVKLMEDIVIKAPQGNPVRLKDFGRVVDGYAERATISRMDGTECVTLRVKKRTGANVVRISEQVHEVMKAASATMPPGTQYTIRQDQSEFIRKTVQDLENNIIASLILVLSVLFFAMSLRNAAFVAMAIPLSMLTSLIILNIMGITLNMVVLFSLILALGMLVDNSIVVVENIYRHVSEGETRIRAAFLATREVAWPIIASTATTLLAFSPLLFWEGVMGSFMQYLPITIIAVLSSSLFVALVINPVVAADFLRTKEGKMFDDSGIARGWFTSRYQRMLIWSLDHPITVLVLSIMSLLGTAGLFVLFNSGVEFFPKVSPERASATITAAQGTVLNKTDELTKKVEQIAATEDNVENIITYVGTSGNFFMSGGATPTNSAMVDVEFKDRHERTHSPWDTVDSIREKLKALVGAEYRINVEEGGPPTGEPVSVEISGPEYVSINKYATQVKKLLTQIPGIVDIKDNYEAGKPEIRVEIDREKAMLRKVNTQSISQAVRAAINGIKASVLREGEEEYDIVVRYDEQFRRSMNDVLNIRIAGNDDVQIPLRDVAVVRTVGGLGSINHIDQKRTIAVTADVTGRSSTEVMQDVEKLVGEKVELPSGYRIKFTGESEEQEKARDFLIKSFGIGIMLMFMVLLTQFNSLIRPAIILASVVMSMIGVMIGLIITQNKVGIIMTGVGIISLAGVVVNNAIVLIDYTDQVKEKHGVTLKEALIRAGVVRFRPVLLTAITTVLGLLPMAIGVSIDFRTLTVDMGSESIEMWGSMAQAVSFGLTFATILTLVLVPVMYHSQEATKNWTVKLLKRIFRPLSSRKQQKMEISS